MRFDGPRLSSLSPTLPTERAEDYARRAKLAAALARLLGQQLSLGECVNYSEMSALRSVSISMPPALAPEVDRIARAERRTRSELLRQALRQYVARFERWERIFAAGAGAARRSRATEAKVIRAVDALRTVQTR